MRDRGGLGQRALSWFGALLVVSACANGVDPPTVGQQTTVTTEASPQTTSGSPTTSVAVSECEGPVEKIDLGATAQGEVVDREFPPDSVYYCVEIPGGVDKFTVSLSGLTADLDLWLGYPDLEVVQEGGIGSVFSDNNGTDDEAVTIVIEPDRLFQPGTYYIEVLSSSGDPSPFTLTVTTP